MEIKHSKTLNSNTYLVWLEWPEKCFRMDAVTLRFLEGVAEQRGARVIRARSERAFLRNLPQATHAIVWNFKEEWFAKAPRLKLLATPAAGQELVPTKGPKGVTVHFGHYHGAYIAEAVAGFMLCWAKGFFAVRNAPASCRAWPRTWLSDMCHDLSGTRAVIVGYGNVGRAIGATLMSLGVEVAGITRHGIFRGKGGSSNRSGKDSASSLGSANRILREADWLIMALPSTTGTDDYLDAALIRKLPRRCVVINVGRGNSVDERALYTALKAKRLAGAYLDVRKHEPSATVLEASGYVPELADLPNCIVMPHSSAFSDCYLMACLWELIDDGCL